MKFTRIKTLKTSLIAFVFILSCMLSACELSDVFQRDNSSAVSDSSSIKIDESTGDNSTAETTAATTTATAATTAPPATTDLGKSSQTTPATKSNTGTTGKTGGSTASGTGSNSGTAGGTSSSTGGTSAGTGTSPTAPTNVNSSANGYSISVYGLNETEKQAYYDIVNGLENYKTSIDISVNVTSEEVSRLYEMAADTARNLAFIPNSYKIVSWPDHTVGLTVAYSCTPEQGKAATAALMNKVNQIKSAAMTKGNDFDKIKYIHDTIIKNCTYNGTPKHAHDAYGALVEGQAVCEGYAKAMALVCNEAGIECTVVIGGNHMWNIIKYNGNWYHMDVTWDDPDGVNDLNYVQYDYFNITTAQVKIDHTISGNCFIVPNATATEGNYFVHTGTNADSYEAAANILVQQLKAAASTNASSISVRLSTYNLYSSTYDKLFSGGGMNEVIKQANVNMPMSYSEKKAQSDCQNVITIILN